ncbi:MAG: 4Fe-4S dicluster domain-containing protein [Calditrichaeota bacterium]|nr:4Fe-4S dicluster domain-containing protein [Calditrichota bacterium]
MRWKCEIIVSECTGCGICADVCAYDAILMTADMAYPHPVSGKCFGCNKCVEECPFAAIEVHELSTATV